MDTLGLSYQVGAMAAERNSVVRIHLMDLLMIIKLDRIDLSKFRDGYIQQTCRNEQKFLETKFVKTLVELRLMTTNLATKYLDASECLNKKILVEVYNQLTNEKEEAVGEIVRLFTFQGKQTVRFKNYNPTNLPIPGFSTDEWYPLISFKIMEVLGDAEPIDPNKKRPSQFKGIGLRALKNSQ